MDITYPRIKYQGVPRAPLQSILQNPGYIYVKVNDADAERALGDNWHDLPQDAIRSVPKDAKLTAEQYALVAAQAVERGAAPPAQPKFDEPEPANPHARPSSGPSDPAAEIPDTQDKPRPQGEWPRESARKR